MGTVKSCLFNILVPPSFDQRKKSETNYPHSYLNDWPVKALQLASMFTFSLQAGKIEILFQLS